MGEKAKRDIDDVEELAEERQEEWSERTYRGEGSLGESEPHRSSDKDHDLDGDRNLEEALDRARHGSGDYDPEERYGRHDVQADREKAGPGDEDEPDTAESEPKRGRSPRKQDPD